MTASMAMADIRAATMAVAVINADNYINTAITTDISPEIPIATPDIAP